MNIQRPEVSKETILSASKIIASIVDGNAEEISNCYYPHINGYELAKGLESNYCWDIHVEMIEELDGIQYEVDSIHKKACIQWVIDEDIKPPLEIGTAITEGVIKGIYKHDAAMYTVIKHGETMENRHYIIKFENAIAI